MIRIGVDFGGTKIEAAALAPDGRFLSRLRVPNPGAYDLTLAALRDLIARIEQAAGPADSIGVGHPGLLSPRTGLIRNANSTWLNGRPFGRDLEDVLGRPVRLANDANLLALSEAVDGAGTGFDVVFAAILGTGCGGGVVVGSRLINGANGVAGEWGHTPLPWATEAERAIAPCWCGRQGCLETWISGTGLSDDHQRRTGARLAADAIVAAARAGDPPARSSLDAYVDRLGRALAVIADIIDPDVIVLGGGMSNTAELYDRLPAAIEPHVLGQDWAAPIRAAMYGDSSGVRGAAWLWPMP